MAKIECEIKFADSDKMKSLFDVLADNLDLLPDEVVTALQEVCEEGSVAYDIDYLRSICVDPCNVKVYVDAIPTEHVSYGDRINRKVYINLKPVKADSFWIVDKHGDFVCGWGEKPLIGEQ